MANGRDLNVGFYRYLFLHTLFAHVCSIWSLEFSCQALRYFLPFPAPPSRQTNIKSNITAVIMKSVAVLAMCCAGAQAFAPGPVARGAFNAKAAPARSASSPSTTVMMAKSTALPFIEAPAALDGSMVGDFGFDPLGLTENINIPYARAAEIKHGRVAMLAVVGFLLTQYVHLPGDQFQEGPLEALTAVPLGAQAQVFSFIATFEMASIFKTFGQDSKDPWETLLQDPQGARLFYKKSAQEQERLKLSEVKHARLAMLAIIGEVTQMLMFHTPSIDNLL